jgi:hypothetical protein
MAKYVVLYHDGIGPYSPFPEMPETENTASTLDECRRMFARWAREGYRDAPTDEGGAWADVDLVSSWDGVSYGDGHLYRLTLGPRGGIITEKW